MKIRNIEINWIGFKKYKCVWYQKLKIEYNYGFISIVVIGPFLVTFFKGK